ncbi:MlaD family protein [Nocardioides sp. AE5]|uniref:MlaD family protein n=1 Tax=Nocardioides sp. AE5 TaxID=2962573 RepID=UPI0028821897|nr:MlaD family protein [Nocardioides sp. AE5]MDT0202022.1 MlaD family protein [Nocardioides sp. AE5]
MGYAEMRRRVRIAQVLLIAIVVAGTFYVTDLVVGGGIFSSPYRVTVQLEGAGGLHDQSTVNYRGQKVGQVKSVRLTPDGVVAEIEIDEGVRVPVDSTFNVRNLSAVGEQYLNIEPNTDQGPFLADGAVIASDRTSLPMPMPQVLADTQQLMKRIDITDIETIANEADDAFGDGSADLRALSVEMEHALALMRTLEPDVLRILEAGQVPLATVAEQADQWRTTAANLQAIAAELRQAAPLVGHLVATAGPVMGDVQALWQETEPVLSELLAESGPLAQMSAERLQGLRHWLKWLPGQLDAMAGSTRDGSGRVLLVPKVLKNCDYGVDRRDPSETAPRTPDPGATCTTDAPGIGQRGAANVPVP